MQYAKQVKNSWKRLNLTRYDLLTIQKNSACTNCFYSLNPPVSSSLLAAKRCHIVSYFPLRSLAFRSESEFNNWKVDHKQSRFASCPITTTNPGCSSLTWMTFEWIFCVPTNPQLLHVALKLWFLLQHLQQISGLHALQLHFVVDVDFVVEANVNQAGSVLTILTGILTCKQTKKVRLQSEAWCDL